MKCPACGTGDFYEGLATLNCVRPGCVHYVPPATYRGGDPEPALVAGQPTDGYLDAWVDTGVRAPHGHAVHVRRGVYHLPGIKSWSRYSFACLKIRPDGGVDGSEWWIHTGKAFCWGDIVSALSIPDGFNVVPRPEHKWAYERDGVEVLGGRAYWVCTAGDTQGAYPRSRHTAREAWEAYTGESFPEDR